MDTKLYAEYHLTDEFLKTMTEFTFIRCGWSYDKTAETKIENAGFKSTSVRYTNNGETIEIKYSKN